jgi:hypothetical protein
VFCQNLKHAELPTLRGRVFWFKPAGVPGRARELHLAAENHHLRVAADARLALLDCRAPSSFLGVPRLSKSTDQATHGKKVYFLYAKKQQAYRDAAKPADQRGQVDEN